MTSTQFPMSGFPQHHEGMLLVKMRSSMARFAPAVRVASMAPDTPGLSAVEALEKRGMVKRVTPLFNRGNAEAVPTLASASTSAAFGTMAMEAETAGAGAGTCMVELESDADIANLQSAFAADPDIEYAVRVPVRYAVARSARSTAATATALPTDALPAPVMWNLTRIRWEEARALKGFKDANEIKVGVLDSGIEPGHPDLVGRVNQYVYSYPGVTAPSGPEDPIGHGTHVAGTIGANSNNGFGVLGICSCDLRAWKIFDDEPDFLRWSVTQGEFVYWVNPIMYRKALAACVDEGVQVVNLSIGGRGLPDMFEKSLFDMLLANGVAIVAAMGNERAYGSPISYPAAIPGVIAVGATNVNDRVASFSNAGDHISLSAPGAGIWSTLPTYPGQSGFDAVVWPDGSAVPGAPRTRGTDYAAWDGTSMASPHVAAAAALLLANAGQMSGADVRAQLQKTADKLPDMMGAAFDRDYGAGRLNLLELLRPYA